MSTLQEYRAQTRALRARLTEHCAGAGINPPALALRRYASLRWLESRWWLRDKMYNERKDLLEDLAFRLRLDKLQPGTPMVAPDLPDCLLPVCGLACRAWGGVECMAGMRDL